MPQSELVIELKYMEGQNEFDEFAGKFEKEFKPENKYDSLRLTLDTEELYNIEESEDFSHQVYLQWLGNQMNVVIGATERLTSLTSVTIDFNIDDEDVHEMQNNSLGYTATDFVVSLLKYLPNKHLIQELNLNIKGVELGCLDDTDDLETTRLNSQARRFFDELYEFNSLHRLKFESADYVNSETIYEMGHWIKNHLTLKHLTFSFKHGMGDFMILNLALENLKLESLSFTDTNIANSVAYNSPAGCLLNQVKTLGRLLESHPYLKQLTLEFNIIASSMGYEDFFEHLEQPLFQNQVIQHLTYHPYLQHYERNQEQIDNTQALIRKNYSLFSTEIDQLDLRRVISNRDDVMAGHGEIVDYFKTPNTFYANKTPSMLIRSQQYLMNTIFYGFYQYIHRDKIECLNPVSKEERLQSIATIQKLMAQFIRMWRDTPLPSLGERTRSEMVRQPGLSRRAVAVTLPGDVATHVAEYLTRSDLESIASVTGGVFFRERKEQQAFAAAEASTAASATASTIR